MFPLESDTGAPHDISANNFHIYQSIFFSTMLCLLLFRIETCQFGADAADNSFQAHLCLSLCAVHQKYGLADVVGRDYFGDDTLLESVWQGKARVIQFDGLQRLFYVVQ